MNNISGTSRLRAELEYCLLSIHSEKNCRIYDTSKVAITRASRSIASFEFYAEEIGLIMLIRSTQGREMNERKLKFTQ